MKTRPLDRLRHHVTGAIERGEAQPIAEQRAQHAPTLSVPLAAVSGRAKIVQLTRQRDALAAALLDLTNWAREHTSPRDANSPHKLLIAAQAALTAAGAQS